MADSITGSYNGAVKINFKITGSDEIQETIKKYVERMHDIRPVGDALVGYFRQLMQRQFESSGAYLGHAWEQLMPSTLADKQRRGTAGNGILRDRLNLYNSLVMGGYGAIEMVTETAITFGSDLYYLGYLDKGTRKMVARPVYGDKITLMHELEREFSLLLSEHVSGKPVDPSLSARGRSTGGGGSEGFLGRAVHEIRETIQKGRERGDKWAENWGTTGRGGGNSSGGPAIGGM